MERLPERFSAFKKYVDEDWDSGEKPPMKDATQQQLDNYVMWATFAYWTGGSVDRAVIAAFQDDFEDWTVDHFKSVRSNIIRELCNVLRERGCYVPTTRQSNPMKLYNLLINGWTTWPKDEITMQAESGGFHPRSMLSINNQAPQRTTTPTPDKPTSTGSRQITDLIKIYNDNSRKYSGNKYDFLSKKLEVFNDYCTKLGLPREQRTNALSVFLCDRALDYYYQRFASTPELPFDN